MISRSSGDGRAHFQARGGCAFFIELSANFGRFVEPRKKIFLDAYTRKDLVGPCALGDIEKKRAGGVGLVNGAIPSQAETDEVLRQHDVANAPPQSCGSSSRTHRSLARVKLVSGGLQVS